MEEDNLREVQVLREIERQLLMEIGEEEAEYLSRCLEVRLEQVETNK